MNAVRIEGKRRSYLSLLQSAAREVCASAASRQARALVRREVVSRRDTTEMPQLFRNIYHTPEGGKWQ